MSATIEISKAMRSKTIRALASALVAGVLLPQAVQASLPIEEAQRSFQARYYLITGTYVSWPPCPCYTFSPNFPPNGFYGDLDHNPVLATELVQDLAAKFYGDAIFYDFLNIPDGHSGIEGEDDHFVVPFYTPDDFPPWIDGAYMPDTGTINQTNYPACFGALRGYIEELKYVLSTVYRQDLAVNGGNGGPTTNGCGAAKALADGAWSSTWFPVDPNQDAIWMNVYTDCSSENDGSTINYKASKESRRGRVQSAVNAGYPSLDRGTLLIYLVVSNYPAGLGATTPPVAADGKYRFFQSSDIAAGTQYTSDLLGDGVPSIAGDCPLGGYPGGQGWYIYYELAVLQPHFKTDPDSVQCGSGNCASCGSDDNIPGKAGAGNHSLELQISLGPDSYGKPAGYFYLHADQFSTALFNPASLTYSTADGRGSVGDLYGYTYTDNAQVYIVESPTNGYGVFFTDWAGGFLSSVTIESNSLPNQMVITEVLGANGSPRVIQFNYTSNGLNSWTWDMIEGNGLRTESRTTTWATPTNRSDTVVVKDGNGAVTSQTTESYCQFPWGLTLVQQTLGTGSSAQTTTWTYYTNAVSDGGGYGQIQQLVEPSGRWELYQYDSAGRLTNRVAQFGNNATNSAASANRVTQVSYDDLNGIITTVEQLLNTEVSRTYQVQSAPQSGVQQIQTIRCATAGAAINNPANLTNILWSTTDTSITGTAWEPIQELHQDGTMAFYSYYNDSPAYGQRTIVVSQGAPNSTLNGIVDGTQTTTTLGDWSQTLSVQVQDVASGLTTDQQTYTYTDDLNRSHTVTYLDLSTQQYTYSCCGLDTYVDRNGTTTQYTYDAARRQVASTRLGIITTNVLDAAGNALTTIRFGTDGSPITLRQAAYDLSGTLTSEINGLGGTTTYSQSFDGSGQTVKTSTHPNGGTRVETYYQDGSLLSVSGTAAYPLQYVYGVDGDGPYTTEIKVAAGGGMNEWVKTSSDLLGRQYKTVFAPASAPALSLSAYNLKGQLTNHVDPDGVITLSAYSTKGEQVYSVLDSNRNYTIDFAGADQITYTTNDVTTYNGATVRRTQVYVWSTFNSAAATLAAVSLASVDGLQSWQTQYRDPNTPVTSHSQTAYGANGIRTLTSTAADGSYTITTNQYGRLLSVSRFDSSGNPLSSISYSYDVHGRQALVTDARNGATSYTYNNADLVSSVTTPNPGTLGGSPQTTTTYYNQMLQAISVVNPDDASVTRQYYLTGELEGQYGSRIYPVGYSYDYAGRVLTMTNWTGFPSAGARVTTWNYDPYRGWLAGKTYDGGTAGPSYTYTPAGRLWTRAWARSVTTTYGYNWAGMLASVSYSDSTPAVTATYDRLGRQATVVQNGMTATMAYNTANEPLSEAFSGGTLAGLSVTNGYDQYLRRTDLAVQYSSTPLLHHSFGYDNASRLQSVTDNTGSPAYSATYTYLANSPLVSQIVFKQSTTTRMTTTKQYDYLNRLTSISSSSSPSISYSYSYNNANQRIRTALVDNTYWMYTYDSLGQVTSGHKYFSDQTPVAGQQFEYGFDDIGNRTQTKAGGDQNGASLRTANYSANNLNQYTSRDVPGAFDVMGLGFATNAVTVNNQAAYRKGEYFRAEVPVSNGSTSVWQSVSVAATNQTTLSGNVFVPKNQEQFSYDQDGNLTNDGRWAYAWDAENRLVQLAPNTSAGPRNSAKFEYDWRGRRIHKQVWGNTSWSGAPTNDVKLIYDGWNLLAELNGTNNALIRSFVWGNDLSGSLQGAGGVGGLLFVCDVPSASGYCAPAYDGNGNVAALVSMSGGTNCATYEYGPFGKVIKATGPMARVNPFRFSTKYQDDETDLLYYGYRFYNPSTGRWMSRDPLGEPGFGLLVAGLQPYAVAQLNDDIERLNRLSSEPGGPNLYGFCANSPLTIADRFGLGYNWGPTGPIPSLPGAYGPYYYPHPYWFEHPADEGQPCCCSPAAKISVKRTDTIGLLQIVMKVDLNITGCYKDLVLIWDTCWRFDNTPWGSESSGAILGEVNSTSALFEAYGVWYLTHANIRYLSCENRKWTKKTATAGRTYSRSLPAVLPWTYTDLTSY